MAIALTDWQTKYAVKWFEVGITVTDIAVSYTHLTLPTILLV